MYARRGGPLEYTRLCPYTFSSTLTPTHNTLMNDSAFIHDVTIDDFNSRVIEQSRSVPVMVDFWAAWCGPCKMLMPLLEKLANEYAGKFMLAKVNSDEQQQLAAEHGVRSLPTVKIFKNGEVVDEFMGVQPEPAIRDIIERHIVRESDLLVSRALDALAAGDLENATTLLDTATALDPNHPPVQIAQARLRIAAGDIEGAQQLIGALPVEMLDDPGLKSLQAQLQFAVTLQSAPDPDTLEQTISTAPDNLAARLQLASHKVQQGEYEAAMEQLLEIMRRNRKFEDDAGHKGLLAIFDILGPGHPLVTSYRRKMGALLF